MPNINNLNILFVGKFSYNLISGLYFRLHRIILFLITQAGPYKKYSNYVIKSIHIYFMHQRSGTLVFTLLSLRE